MKEAVQLLHESPRCVSRCMTLESTKKAVRFAIDKKDRQNPSPSIENTVYTMDCIGQDAGSNISAVSEVLEGRASYRVGEGSF